MGLYEGMTSKPLMEEVVTHNVSILIWYCCHASSLRFLGSLLAHAANFIASL